MQVWGRRCAALVSAVGLTFTLLGVGTSTPATAKATFDTTSAIEERRVDSVPTPSPAWDTCLDVAECALVELPVDYDEPGGPTTEVALLRIKARDQKKRVGTLFVNPGGPGGSGTALAFDAPSFLSDDLLQRFDIVGFDPRGTNFSDNINCFDDAAAADPVLQTLFSEPFPTSDGAETAFIDAYDSLARACSTTGQPLAGSASTAQVARDLDVLRRAVGDAKLSYLGFSYGSYLGQVYANMFPDRVRALAIDGVLDPIGWSGTDATKAQPLGDRMGSAEASQRALTRIFERCDAAGPAMCRSAAGGAAANFDRVVERLKADPLVATDPASGDQVVVRYADLVALTVSALYSAHGFADIDSMVADLLTLTAAAEADEPIEEATLQRLAASVEAVQLRYRSNWRRSNFRRSNFRRSNFARSYDNYFDSLLSVSCTDSLDSGNLADLPHLADAADDRVRYFGRYWSWLLAGCASPGWSAEDEDSYRGPFDRQTVAPVLIVGNLWDPATNYASAVAVSRLLPNSRLLTSNSWGHSAYGTSACTTSRIDRYLLSGTLPGRGVVCTGDIQPFAKAQPKRAQRRSNFILGLRPWQERQR